MKKELNKIAEEGWKESKEEKNSSWFPKERKRVNLALERGNKRTKWESQSAGEVEELGLR